MDFLTEFVPVLFQICIFPLLGILTKYLVALITEKINAITAEKNDVLFTKYMTMVNETITDCVLATNQTYVNALKAEGKFDLEAQKVAFQKTYEAVMTILSEDAKAYLISVIGDLDKLVTDKIEAQVVAVKAVG